MIPPQVNGATYRAMELYQKRAETTFPMIPPQVNGATSDVFDFDPEDRDEVSNDSAPS